MAHIPVCYACPTIREVNENVTNATNVSSFMRWRQPTSRKCSISACKLSSYIGWPGLVTCFDLNIMLEYCLFCFGGDVPPCYLPEIAADPSDSFSHIECMSLQASLLPQDTRLDRASFGIASLAQEKYQLLPWCLRLATISLYRSGL